MSIPRTEHRKVLVTGSDGFIGKNLRLLLKERKDLGGFYVATANSVIVCKYIEDNNISGIRIVGTDVSPEICAYMSKDIIQGVIFQDIVNQGRISVRTVVDHLVRKIPIARDIFIPPQLLLTSNLDCHSDQYKVFRDLKQADP